MQYRIVETREGFDLLRNGKYVASFRSRGAASAAREVETQRRERRALALRIETGAGVND